MQPVTRIAETELSVARIWARLSVMDWQAWDPDVQAMKDIKGGLAQDASFTYILNNGIEFQSRFDRVSPQKEIHWSGSAKWGLLGYRAALNFTEMPNGCRIDYQFEMTRPFGWVVNWRYYDLVIHGVEEGLNGILREAAKSA